MTQVLLVEDAAFFERVIRRQLNEIHGLQVLSAASLAEARELLARPDVEPVVALVDLTLPDAPDGEVVDLALAAKLPTIVFTGRFDEKLRQMLLGKGVVDYILKDSPASLTYLTSLVQRICANHTIDALVVDDSRVDAEVVVRRLKHYRLRVHCASDTASALAQLDKLENLRLVVLDYLMPNVDGFELLRALRRRYGMQELAVVGLSGQASAEVIARFLKSGANDFLPKSCTPEEFMLRISQNLDMLDRLKNLDELAHRDALTGLSNRRHLFSEGNALFERCRRANEEVAVAILDMDTFKLVNDRHGHDRGDALLAAFGQIMLEVCPQPAFPARLGGDEFCVILPGMTQPQRQRTLDRLSEELAQVTSSGALRDIGRVTLSAGLSGGQEASLSTALTTADNRLYEAKDNGRDRIVLS